MSRTMVRPLHLAPIVVGLVVGCSDSTPRAVEQAPAPPAVKVVRIESGPDAPKKAQEALIIAKAGDIVEFAEGTFDFKSTLSLDLDSITVRGKGAGKTILRFSNQGQGTGGEGILVTAKKRFTLEDLSIVDARGDGVKVNGTTGVVFRGVEVAWSGGAKSTNGGYGIYPVLCTDVLIEKCRVSGASDAGIYVGQSRNIIVRNNRVEGNVAGIEVENSVDADVHGNDVTDNTGGILVFTLPDLPKKDGRNCRVFKNKVVANNRENFAPKGNIVASVPPGTGLMIMANDRVEIFDNTIEKNDSSGVTVVSYLILSKPIKDKDYDPYCEAISIRENRFAGNGGKPTGTLPTLLSAVLGSPLPDIVHDGMFTPAKEEKGTDPKLPGLSIRDNGEARFANFDARAMAPEALLKGRKPKIVTDLKLYAEEIPPLPEVKIEGRS